MTLSKTWLLTILVFPSKEGWFSNSVCPPLPKKNFSIRIFKRCDLKGHTCDMWHDSILGEGQTAHGTACDSNPCYSDRNDKEDRSTWPQIIHEQFLFIPWIILWRGKETDLLLWDCQAKQERHITWPSTQDNKAEMERHLHKDQGWCDGTTVVGQVRQTFACWRTFMMPQQKVISAMEEEQS